MDQTIIDKLERISFYAGQKAIAYFSHEEIGAGGLKVNFDQAAESCKQQDWAVSRLAKIALSADNKEEVADNLDYLTNNEFGCGMNLIGKDIQDLFQGFADEQMAGTRNEHSAMTDEQITATRNMYQLTDDEITEVKKAPVTAGVEFDGNKIVKLPDVSTTTENMKKPVIKIRFTP